jgi:two-component system OmpR family response regulator
MTALRVLHVDDEPDIREVVEISLGLDPDFTVRSCPSGGDAITAAADWSPDLILLDVMMPGMDGPTTLARLRESPQTNEIPVVFMTARAQPRELEHFRALGAEGVISKPFDPLTLAASVRRHMQPPKDPLAGPRSRFLNLARTDAMALTRDRLALADEANAGAAFERIKAIAHRLAGGGGTVGYHDISTKAFALEQAVIDLLDASDTTLTVKRTLDALVDVIERA